MKKFTVITKDGSKWLRPVNPFEKYLIDEFGGYRNPNHRLFSRDNPDILYLGSHPEGTTVDEGEVMEVRQMQYEGKWIPAEEDLIDFATLTTRTVYTDAESHDRQISDEYPGIDYQPLFNHMSKVHGLTLTAGEMDEIIGLSTYILAKK